MAIGLLPSGPWGSFQVGHADLQRRRSLFLVTDFVVADTVGHSYAAASRTALTMADELPPQRKRPHDDGSAAPSAPSHVWPLVAKAKAALTTSKAAASASGSAESASIAESKPTAVAVVERSSSEESEDPCPDVFVRDWSGSYRDASGQRWQLASIVFDRGANMVHERWQREPPPIQPVNATDRQE